MNKYKRIIGLFICFEAPDALSETFLKLFLEGNTMTNAPAANASADQKPASPASPATPQRNQGSPKPENKPSEQQK